MWVEENSSALSGIARGVLLTHSITLNDKSWVNKVEIGSRVRRLKGDGQPLGTVHAIDHRGVLKINWDAGIPTCLIADGSRPPAQPGAWAQPARGKSFRGRSNTPVGMPDCDIQVVKYSSMRELFMSGAQLYGTAPSPAHRLHLMRSAVVESIATCKPRGVAFAL
jgi:hypothetical protein